MAMTVGEVKDWLAGLDDSTLVGVDEGGLVLRAVGLDAYLEVGGSDVDDGRSCAECGADLVGNDPHAPGCSKDEVPEHSCARGPCVVISCGKCGAEHCENDDCPVSSC